MKEKGGNSEMSTKLWTFLRRIFMWLPNFISRLIGRNDGVAKSSKCSTKGIKDLPGPISLPFFGTTFSTCQVNPSDRQLANEVNFRTYGPIFKHEYYWNIPIVELGDADDIDMMYKSSVLRPPLQIIATYRELHKERYDTVGVTNLNGENWQRLRKKTTQHILNSKHVNSYIGGLDGIAGDFVKKVSTEGHTIMEAADTIFSYAFESIFYFFLGHRVGFLGQDKIPDHLAEFMENGKIYFDSFSKSSLGFPWWQYFPTKVWTNFASAEDQLFDTLQKVVEDTKNLKKKTTGMMDLFAEQNLSKSEVQTTSLEYIMGGTDPILQALILSLYWISKHENVQEKLYQELRSHLVNKDSEITEECLNRLVYLQACMMESFRFCPTTPNMARITEKDLEIQGYNIPAYTVIIGQNWHCYMQEQNFYMAKKFIPERWLLNSEGQPNFQPHYPDIVRLFGAGRRICPGNKYATLSIKIFLAKVFRNFKIKFLQDLDIKYLFLVLAANSFDIEFAERRD